MDDNLRDQVKDLERENRSLKELLSEIKLGIGHVQSMYDDVDERGNEHANRIDAVKRSLEVLESRISVHQTALFNPPDSIYMKLDRLEEWKKQKETMDDRKWPLLISLAGIALSVLTFLLTYVIKK